MLVAAGVGFAGGAAGGALGSGAGNVLKRFWRPRWEEDRAKDDITEQGSSQLLRWNTMPEGLFSSSKDDGGGAGGVRGLFSSDEPKGAG
eukprot:gene12562-55261_t